LKTAGNPEMAVETEMMMVGFVLPAVISKGFSLKLKLEYVRGVWGVISPMWL